MKILIVAISLIVGLTSYAEDVAFEMGAGVRWEQGSGATSIDPQGMLGLGVSYAWENLKVTGEFNHFGSQSIEGASISVDRSHYEFMAWLSYQVRSVGRHQFLVSGGLGTFWENVTTSVANISSTGSGGLEFLLGLAGNYKYRFNKNWGVNLRVGMVMNTNNSLAPVADTLVRVSYDF